MRTRITIINSMNVNMFLQMNNLLEQLPANRTIVAFLFLTMNFDMTTKRGITQESFGANTATQRLQLVRSMDGHMTGQSLIRSETLVTKLAFVRFRRVENPSGSGVCCRRRRFGMLGSFHIIREKRLTE